ncbi:MAG: DUF3482 domain-containing protein [Gammaproteobacteria bacterium]
MTTVAVSLISHTNAGKTTLARTLLGQDVGEVDDAPHVTTENTAYPLITSPEGDVLMLWDTPGFGDSKRLANRLVQQDRPVGWFLSQVWDRFRDRSFWLTQMAVSNVREHADVVLYLVNASESAANAGYLPAEMALLEWLGKPVIVLLNQAGAAHSLDNEAEHISAWHEALRQYPQVHDVLALDAFARCWVQELTLFRRLRTVLPADKQSALERLSATWESGQWLRLDKAMEALAMPIARAACTRIPVPPRPLLRWVGAAIGLKQDDPNAGAGASSRLLASQLEKEQRACTNRLLAIYDLHGEASEELAELLDSDFINAAPVAEGRAAAIGGLVSGATTGLAADLAAGGLTLGGGMLAGAVLGAVAGAGIARGVNVVRGETEANVRWGDAFLDGLVQSALLRYLAVAHYGRGRGDWQDSEFPPIWRSLAERAVAKRQAALADIWSLREPGCESSALAPRIAEELGQMTRTILNKLYPHVLPQQDPA